MDPADAYVNLYDQLHGIDADTLSDWSDTAEVKELAEQVCFEVEQQGFLRDSWMPPRLTKRTSMFAVLLGLDLALLNAGKDTDHLTHDALDHLRVRLTMTGRLNDRTSGALLFKRTSWLRPTDDPEVIDGFLNLLRLPAHLSSDIHIQFVPEAYDLPDTEAVPATDELDSPPPLVIAQLPFLAEPSDLSWSVSHPAFYNVGPASERLLPHVREALDALDDSGAAIALLPEASLDDDLLDKWCHLLKSSPRPDKSMLTWLFLGSGPVLGVGPQPVSNRVPNRAVVMHRSGCARLLMTQDKRSGFSFTTNKQQEYGVDLGGVKRDEHIPHNNQVNLLEARCGRFGVQICEDFGRLDRRASIVAAGVTHLVVPVLAAAMWEHGWQAKAGEDLGISAGTKVAVANGLAIQRFYENAPAPTLLTVTGPATPPQQYLTTNDLIHVHSNVNGKTMTAREDALKPRIAHW